MSILEGELAAEVTAALIEANVPRPLTIERPGEYDGWSDERSPATFHQGQGWIELFEDSERDGTLILTRDVRVMILVNTIDTNPSSADTLHIGGESYSIVTSGRDASGTLFVLHARQ